MNHTGSTCTRSNRTVWLSYVGFPVTTAAYFDRALRQTCRTVTIGPPLPAELIERWHLQNMNAPEIAHDIVTDFTPDMTEVIEQTTHPSPDLYLWIESVPGHEPRNLHALPCPTACYLIDSHLNLARHLEIAPGFDYVFIAQREYLPQFRKVNPRSYWLPLGCDPDVHRPWPGEKRHDVGFVGGVFPGSEREALLKRLGEAVPVHFERCFWDDMARLFSESRIVFNNAVKQDLNMRFFEVLSTGTLLLSDMALGSGQAELFTDGEDYACYTKEKLAETALFYLRNEDLREGIARRGRRLAHNAHTYRHRVEDLLAVALNGKPDTWSAEELREKSLAGVPGPIEEIIGEIQVKSPERSFIIPVLDYSPASEYNILSLLDDLSDISGEVIVVFNGATVGEELKAHPRITRHAIMKQNVGVARGWNIGLDMAEGKTAFIVNADAHIFEQAVLAVETGLRELPSAACVGPQGAFFDFSLCKDFAYFDKGSFDRPMEVDAVSGFFFALDRELCTQHGIRFENTYTPCYLEEWDLGLQLRRAGLKSYIVPTTAYDHHWSGTIAALRTIGYLGREETAGEILLRNRRFFLAKWRSIAAQERRPELLESGWKKYRLGVVRELLAKGQQQLAYQAAQALQAQYPDDFAVASMLRCASLS